ncbi:MAG: c-type cytochrome [Proteobacteria bacterium]|nr:c-type cytochrome [Pseudomonadota bacterium]
MRTLRIFCALLLLLAFALFGAAFSNDAHAARDSNSEGKRIYEARCAWCHDSDGTGYGVAAKYLNPPPRDFSMGEFKWKSSHFGSTVPTEADLYAMISGLSEKSKGSSSRGSSGWSGIAGTSMPGWDDILSKKEIEAVAAYVLSLAYIEEPLPVEGVDLSGRVKSTEESIKSGRKLFKDRCSECHGMRGRGNASKRLKDDTGERTWARNLTKPWLFRTGSGRDAVFTRISTGIDGTQMPAFANPKSRKALTETERWDVANFVVSIVEQYKEPLPGTVIEAVKVTGALPESPTALEWDRAAYASFYMLPQIVAKERHFTPSVESVSIKALYNSESLSLLLEWDDPTESLPGERKSEKIAGGSVYVDAAAVQFPRELAGFSDGSGSVADTPYFGMGSAKKPVDIWYWNGPGYGTAESVRLIEAKGAGALEHKEGATAGLVGMGVYDEGTWRVVMTRSLDATTGGGTLPVAFALWDGSNTERGSKHTMTSWTKIAFETETDIMLYILPAFLFILVLGIEIVWLCNIDRW